MGMIELLIGGSICGLLTLGLGVLIVVVVIALLVGIRSRRSRPYAPPPPPQPPVEVPPEGPEICAACGAENRPGSSFCDQCGAPL